MGPSPPGTETLLSADDTIQALIEEVRARGDDSVIDATKDGEPWETKLPTALVLLQDPEETTFRDALFAEAGDTRDVHFPSPPLVSQPPHPEQQTRPSDPGPAIPGPPES